MKNSKSLYIIVLIGIVFASSGPGWCQDDRMTGEQMVKKVMDLVNPVRMKSTLEQTIETSSGEERKFTYEMFSENKGEKTLMRYTEPSRVKGQAFLMQNFSDDIWAYFPKTGRVRKLATHAKKQKVMGSDFTYEDLGSGESWLEDYDTSRETDQKVEGFECHKLSMTAREGVDVSYPRMNVFVRKDNYLPVVIDYYGENNDHLKTLKFDDVEVIEEIPTAKKMIMKNVKDGTQTVLKTLTVTYRVEFEPDFFSSRELSK